MGVLEKLNIGIAGAAPGRRGTGYKMACDWLENVRIHAVCDIKVEALEEARETLGAAECYSDYEDMLDRSELDVVIIATPMPLHAPQATLALQKDLHVLSEVTAAVSLDQCRQLVEACNTSKGVYMLAENCTYFTSNMVVRELVRQGLFGTTYYAEGEYLHEIKRGAEVTPWRRKWQMGIDGITYGTHGLGPVLQWMPGDRIVSVCCAGSGYHHRDPRGDFYAQDTSVMLGKMKNGGLVKARVDMLSDRPFVTCAYQLQGADGCYESARTRGGQNRIWLRDRCKDHNTWLDLAQLEDEFLPPRWRQVSVESRETGHEGSEIFEMMDFIDAVEGKHPSPIGIHEAMDMTLPGLISQQSINQEGQWLEAPDSRRW